jgi:hypothetical protein
VLFAKVNVFAKLKFLLIQKLFRKPNSLDTLWFIWSEVLGVREPPCSKAVEPALKGYSTYRAEVRGALCSKLVELAPGQLNLGFLVGALCQTRLNRPYRRFKGQFYRCHGLLLNSLAADGRCITYNLID